MAGETPSRAPSRRSQLWQSGSLAPKEDTAVGTALRLSRDCNVCPFWRDTHHVHVSNCTLLNKGFMNNSWGKFHTPFRTTPGANFIRLAEKRMESFIVQENYLTKVPKCMPRTSGTMSPSLRSSERKTWVINTWINTKMALANKGFLSRSCRPNLLTPQLRFDFFTVWGSTSLFQNHWFVWRYISVKFPNNLKNEVE